MILKHVFGDNTIQMTALFQWMLAGAVPAFLLIGLFLISAGEGNPEWPSFWMLRPLVVVPMAGAMGGAFFYILQHVRYMTGIKILAILLGIVGYIISVWLGTVLGLDGTYWN